jgi:hypothetical protein
MTASESWQVLVPPDATAWSHAAVPPLDSPEWVEAWDGIVPGYRRRRYESEAAATAACRLLRGQGHTALSEPCDG